MLPGLECGTPLCCVWVVVYARETERWCPESALDRALARVLSCCVGPKVSRVWRLRSVCLFVCVWCGVCGVFEVCVSFASASPVIDPLADGFQVPGVPSLECPGWLLCE